MLALILVQSRCHPPWAALGRSLPKAKWPAGTACGAVSASVQITPLTPSRSVRCKKTWAGFNRHFRFTRQNTFVRLSKTTAVQIQTLKTQQLKENVYEKSKDNVHIGSAGACLLCCFVDSAGSTAANAHPDTDCHPTTR